MLRIRDNGIDSYVAALCTRVDPSEFHTTCYFPEAFGLRPSAVKVLGRHNAVCSIDIVVVQTEHLQSRAPGRALLNNSIFDDSGNAEGGHANG